MRISFSAYAAPKKGSVILPVAQGAKLSGQAKALDDKTGGAISHAMKAAGFEGKMAELLQVVGPKGTQATRIILLGVGKAADVQALKLKDAGGALATTMASLKDAAATMIVDPIAKSPLSEAEIATNIAYGLKRRSYEFTKYRTGENVGAKLKSLTVQTGEVTAARRIWKPMGHELEGIFIARDLVNEPPNILHPKEFARRAKALEKLGITYKVLGEAAQKKLGMGAYLGVGLGSAHENQLVILEWNGAAKTKKPICFVGKGLCFDSGGISLKPGNGMWDMKMDMGGAATVMGLMHTLASRKAKVNAVGFLVLAENMPDAKAQRPADIVTSMSGQTIEVLNTDAEGRLVLCDALWYAQDKYKPQIMIDLATLTGAIIMALGHDNAGLFSNNDALAENLKAASEASGDGIWRMPIGPNYHKQLKSSVADMANISRGGGAGSITAACFLEKFVNDVPWAHIDIAGAAWRPDANAASSAGATGYGVALLNQLVKDTYE